MSELNGLKRYLVNNLFLQMLKSSAELYISSGHIREALGAFRLPDAPKDPTGQEEGA
jgi:hypothetical protein